MKHVGDITKLRGADLDPVDCVTGGSPCQDLSIAGNRAGLAGERSGLYMEQIRVIRELREEDAKRGRAGRFIRPRWMVWENVPGAFSSNKGKDFAAVLEEAVRIVQPEAPDVSVPEKGWPKSGCLYDELGAWSIAWRVHDAQFWGVPQRRKRISLVADFGGLSAPEILFERTGLSWHPDESGAAEQGTTPGTESSPLGAISFQERGGKPGGVKGILIQNERIGALSTLNNQSVCCFEPRSPDGVPRIHQGGGDPTLNTAQGGQRQPCVAGFAQQGFGDYISGEVASSLKQRDCKDATTLAVDCRNLNETEECSNTLQSKNQGGYSLNYQNPVRVANIVRRLTPTECERLQGFPDEWTDIGPWRDSKGKLHKESSDSARYKALGNSIALPFWFWLLRRISAQYERPATLGSLFDGIGGFPLCWERCNGKGTALWASEIEEFPTAVTKARFEV